MKYCPECGSEFEDSVKVCADCPTSPELTARPSGKDSAPRVRTHPDERRFVVAVEVEDPLTAEDLANALEAASIPVIARAKQGGSVDMITTATMPSWEILVPTENLDAATMLIDEEMARIKDNAVDAAKAAEEEEAETEGKTAG